MKRLKFILLIVVVCLSLCSCKELDEMKRCHALNLGNGVLELNNVSYKLFKVESDCDIVFNHDRHVYVTDPDVPVLLSQMGFFKFLPSINKDDTIIYEYDSDYYIREDKYELYKQSVKNGINYTDIVLDFYDEFTGETNTYVLSDLEKQAVLSAVSSKLYGEYPYIDDEINLYFQSDDGLFRDDLFYSIVKSSGEYYIVEYSETPKTYCTSDESKQIFENLFRKYLS